MKFIKILFIILLISNCASLDQSKFSSYKNDVSSFSKDFSYKLEKSFHLGERVFIKEVSFEFEEILSIEINRNEPFSYEASNKPFYYILKDTQKKVNTINSFLTSYSEGLYNIANSNIAEVAEEEIKNIQSSTQDVLDNLNLSNVLVEEGLDATSKALSFIYERVSIRQRKEMISEISQAYYPIVKETLLIYFSIIEDLEFTLYDYYSRGFFILENIYSNKEDYLEREELAERILQHRKEYLEVFDNIQRLKNKLNDLIKFNEDFHLSIGE